MRLAKFSGFLILSLISFLMVACNRGGSGGGGDAPSPPPSGNTHSISGSARWVTTLGADAGPIAGVAVSVPGAPSVTTDENGKYTLPDLANGAYMVTVMLAGHSFTPPTQEVVVNGGDVDNINFTELTPLLNTGSLVYPGFQSVVKRNLATAVESPVWTTPGPQPAGIVSLREEGSWIVFKLPNSGDKSGIYAKSLVSPGPPNRVSPFGVLVQPSFVFNETSLLVDVASNEGAHVAPVAIYCECPEGLERTDIFLAILNGSSIGVTSSFRVTDSLDKKTSPVFGALDTVTRNVPVFYYKPATSEIWKQIVHVPLEGIPSLVGVPELVVANVSNGDRIMSVNDVYTHMAYARQSGEASHIIVRSLTDNAEVDLGEGMDPSWAYDGSGLILFRSSDGHLWAIRGDGTGKKEVPTPSSLLGPSSGVVFAPATGS